MSESPPDDSPDEGPPPGPEPDLEVETRQVTDPSEVVQESEQDAVEVYEIPLGTSTVEVEEGDGETVERQVQDILEVTCRDPGNNAVLMGYVQSQDKDAAMRHVWRAAIEDPEWLYEPDNYDNLPTKVKNSLGWKILTDLLGFNRVFLESMGEVLGPAAGSESQQNLGSVAPSLKNLGGTQEQSEDGTGRTSGKPTSTPNEDESSADDTSSKTSPTSSRTPSQKSQSSTPSEHLEGVEAIEE